MEGIGQVYLITLKGRIKLRTKIGEYQRKARADGVRGQADLIYRTGEFYLIAVVVDAPEQSGFDPVGGALGVDLGIENLATDSDGQVFCGGEKVEKARKRYNNGLRARLQKKGVLALQSDI